MSDKPKWWKSAGTVADPVSSSLTFPYGTSTSQSPFHRHQGSKSPRASGSSGRLWRTSSPHSMPNNDGPPPPASGQQVSGMRAVGPIKRRPKLRSKPLPRSSSTTASAAAAGSASASASASATASGSAGSPPRMSALPPTVPGSGGSRSPASRSIHFDAAADAQQVSRTPKPRRTQQQQQQQQQQYRRSQTATSGRRNRLPKPITVPGGSELKYDYLDDVAKAAPPSPLQLLEHQWDMSNLKPSSLSPLGNDAAGGVAPGPSLRPQFSMATPLHRAASSDSLMSRHSRGGPGSVVSRASSANQHASSAASVDSAAMLHLFHDELASAVGGSRTTGHKAILHRMQAEQEEAMQAVQDALDVGDDAAALARQQLVARRMDSLRSLHQLSEPTTEEAKDSRVQQHETMINEWSEHYDVPNNEFASPVVAAEVKLKRADVFSGALPRPNALLTAVAFEALDMVTSHSLHFQRILRQIRDTLLDAVYKERGDNASNLSPYMRDLLDYLADGDGCARDFNSLEAYFSTATELEDERDRLQRVSAELKDTLEQVQRQQAAVVESSNKKHAIVAKWKQAIARDKQQKALEGLMGKIDEANKTIQNLASDSFEAQLAQGGGQKQLAAAFAHLSEEDQTRLFRKLFDKAHRGSHDDTLAYVVTSMSASAGAQTVINQVLQSGSFGKQHIRGVFQSLLTKAAQDAPGFRANLLGSVMSELSVKEQARVVQKIAQSSGDEAAAFKELVSQVVSVIKCEPHELARLNIAAGNMEALSPATQATVITTVMQTLPADAFKHIINSPHFLERIDELDADTRRNLLERLLANMEFDDKGTQCDMFEEATGVPMRDVMATVDDADPHAMAKLLSQAGAERAARAEARLAAEAAGTAPSSPVNKHRRNAAVEVVLPWSKYFRPPRKVANKVPKIKVANVLSTMYDCYEKKLLADSTDDRVRAQSGALPRRQPLGEFVKDFLINKFGLASLRDNYLFGLVRGIGKHEAKHPRIRLFGVLCGVLETSKYSQRICDIFLHITKLIFPKFSAQTLRARKENEAYIKLEDGLNAVFATFLDTAVSFSVDTIQLSEGRLQQLSDKLVAAAITFADVQVKLREGASTPMSPKGGSKAGGSKHKLHPDTPMISYDDLVWECINTWFEQNERDKEVMQQLFHEFDFDGNGVLSLEEFTTLVQKQTPDTLPQRDMTALFQEVLDLDRRGDEISAPAFAIISTKYGITPTWPEGKSSSVTTSKGLAKFAAQLSGAPVASPAPSPGPGSAGAGAGAGAGFGADSGLPSPTEMTNRRLAGIESSGQQPASPT